MRKLFYSISIISLLVSCSDNKYIIDNNKVYIIGWNEGNGNYKRVMKIADAKTFQTIKTESDYCNLFGKDKNFVFMDQEIIDGADPKTFKFVGNHIFKDKNYAYYFGMIYNDRGPRIDSIDINNLKLLESPWAKSGKRLIWGYTSLKLTDINDFLPINEDYGKTKKHIIFQGIILENVDYESFEVIDGGFAKDKNHNYFFGEIDDRE
jgi:hypothetical protein